jgi:hypothetical protein
VSAPESRGWYLRIMKKASLYIDPEVGRASERPAVAEGITKAESVRRVLAADSGRYRPQARGVFEGPRNFGAGAKRYLSETRFGERWSQRSTTPVP